MNSRLYSLALICPLLTLMGCTSYAPMPTVGSVDLNRFMGDWYVVANIPTFIEKEAYNPLENYRLEEDGAIATTFTFNEGGFDGELKTYRPTGYVEDRVSNALWGMQFIWPIRSDYRIVYLDEDYQNTIIAREARDYVWVMSRRPHISGAQFERFKEMVEKLGYDVSRMQQPPHQPVTEAKEIKS